MIGLITEILKVLGEVFGLARKQQEPAPRIERTDSKLAKAIAKKKLQLKQKEGDDQDK